jgi:hypothetical protein
LLTRDTFSYFKTRWQGYCNSSAGSCLVDRSVNMHWK